MTMQDIADILEFDLEDVEMLVDMFLTDANVSLENIEHIIDSNDFEQIKNIAHSIKGSASNLMLEEIREVALEIEDLAKSQTSANYNALFQKLQLELKTIEAIKVEA